MNVKWRHHHHREAHTTITTTPLCHHQERASRFRNRGKGRENTDSLTGIEHIQTTTRPNHTQSQKEKRTRKGLALSLWFVCVCVCVRAAMCVCFPRFSKRNEELKNFCHVTHTTHSFDFRVCSRLFFVYLSQSCCVSMFSFVFLEERETQAVKPIDFHVSLWPFTTSCLVSFITECCKKEMPRFLCVLRFVRWFLSLSLSLSLFDAVLPFMAFCSTVLFWKWIYS